MSESAVVEAMPEQPPLLASESLPHVEQRNGRKPLPHAFTKETAAEMARRSTESRQNRILERERKAAELLAQSSLDPYQTEQLKITRAQIAHVDRLIGQCVLPDHMVKLATAKSRLQEIEQRLAMRASPGTMRPNNKPLRPQRLGLAPIE